MYTKTKQCRYASRAQVAMPIPVHPLPLSPTHLVPLHHAPGAAAVGVCGYAAHDHGAAAAQQRAVGQVGVARDPAAAEERGRGRWVWVWVWGEGAVCVR